MVTTQIAEGWTSNFAGITPYRSWVLVVAGGLLQVPAVKAAKSLGYKVLVTDRNPHCACAELADHFEAIDTFDVEAHLDLVLDWLSGFAAVFTAGADPIVTVAEVAWARNCHGVPREIANICASKVKTRERLRFKGGRIRQPRYWTFDSWMEFNDLLHSTIPFGSYIVKSDSGSGSRGHTFIRWHPQTIENDWREACDRALAGNDVAIIEQCIDGIVLSVETLWYDGEMLPLNAVERPFNGVIELGHYNPLVANAATYGDIWMQMYLAGVAIGMDDTIGGHILKGDLIVSKDGAYVIELTTRLSGGFDSAYTSPMAHGVNYIKGALLLALGRDLDEAMPYFMTRHHLHAACMAVFGPPRGGVIKEIQGVDAARELAQEVIVRYEVGDVLPPLVDCTQRVAFCIAVDKCPHTARDLACAARDCIKVVCE